MMSRCMKGVFPSMRRPTEANSSALVIFGSIRALTPPLVAPLPLEAAPREAGSISGCIAGSERESAGISRSEAEGAGIGCSSRSVSDDLGGVAFPVATPLPFKKAASSGLSASSKLLRLATGNLFEKLLHFVAGEQCCRTHLRDNIPLSCGIGKGLPVGQSR